MEIICYYSLLQSFLYSKPPTIKEYLLLKSGILVSTYFANIQGATSLIVYLSISPGLVIFENLSSIKKLFKVCKEALNSPYPLQ